LLPETSYVDGRGRIAAHSPGAISRTSLEQGIGQVIRGGGQMKWLLAAGVAALFVVGALAAAFGVANRGETDVTSGSAAVEAPGDGVYRGSEPPGVNPLPAFSLRNYDGRLVRSDELEGDVVVLTFLDSQCSESCPIIASQIGQAVDRLAAGEREQVVTVAISTDPAEDTPASVRGFLRKQRALGKLLYLSGPEAEMRALWKRFNILSSEESGEDTLHSAPVRVYDRDLIWVATLHAGIDLIPENLLHDVRVALKDGR
jgi:protein SCO1/2